MRRLRHTAFIVFVFCVVFGVSRAAVQTPAPAQPKPDPGSKKARLTPQFSSAEKGSFKILVEGEPKGSEEFEIVPSGSQVLAKGAIRLTVSRGDVPVNYSMQSEVVMKPNGDPISYTMVQKTPGYAATIKMNFTLDKATAEFNTGSGTERREYQLDSDVTILDDNVFHHYILLVHRYDFDKGGLQEFSAFIPQESLGGILRVILKGDERAEIDGKPVDVQHLLVDTNDLKMDLFVEGKDHRLVKIEVPSSKVVVVRQ